MKKKILTIIRNIFKGLLNVFIVVVGIFLVLSIYNFVNLKMMNKRYTNYFGYTFMNVSSGSMEPTIKVNDYVFIKIGNKNLKKGDIVSYKIDKGIVTHRIVSINDKEVILKGDANNTNDSPIKKKDIIGKVVFIGRKMGIYINVIKTPAVFISFFVTIIFFDIALSPKEVVKDEKKEKK